MSLTMRQRLELARITRPEPKTLLTGMPWTERNNAASHSDIANFRDRQISRGLKVKEQK